MLNWSYFISDGRLWNLFRRYWFSITGQLNFG